jgi:nitrate/TMAO reductase-like tetraheme cytochrome c subunit
MKKLSISVLLIAVVLFIGSTAVVSGESDEEMCVPMGIITLEPPDSVEPQRSSVEFPHSKHFIDNCKTCHHTWTFTEPIKSCTASGCHDLSASPRKPEKGPVDLAKEILYYKAAYHQNCIGCHQEIKIQNMKLEMTYKKLNKELPKSGPTGCIECHPRE